MSIRPYQATLAYDADGNGSNEASGASDDPTTAAADDATVFAVAQPVGIPTLGAGALAGLALALAILGRRRLRGQAR